MNVEEIIETLVLDKLEAEGWQDVFIVEIRYIQPKNTVQVFLDSDDSVSYEQCTKISRSLEEYLDESGLLGEKYTLEVSSAGLDRPLSQHRQFQKNVGREMRIVLTDGSQMVGTMTKADENFIDLLLNDNKKETTVAIPREEIKEAYVQVKF